MPFDLANWESQARKGLMEMVLLRLMRDGERYGYDLVRNAQEVLQQRVVEGTVYPLLSRLARDGLVEARWVVQDAGSPRKYYRLTADGHAALEQMTAAWSRLSDHLNPWLGS